jgi:hypothetical protein
MHTIPSISQKIWSTSSAPVVADKTRAEPESDAEEPKRLSDPKIVGITRQIEGVDPVDSGET